MSIYHYTDRYDTVENIDYRNDNRIPLMDSYSRRMLEFVTAPLENVNIKASDDKRSTCGLSKDDLIPAEYVNNSIEEIRIHFFFIFSNFKFQISNFKFQISVVLIFFGRSYDGFLARLKKNIKSFKMDLTSEVR